MTQKLEDLLDMAKEVKAEQEQSTEVIPSQSEHIRRYTEQCKQIKLTKYVYG